MINTPSANRLFIGIYGKTNSGKSSFINALTKQQVSIVSDVAGTTTDPVYKNMEIYPLGPCTLIDTAGFDDVTSLGEARLEKTFLAVEKTDIAVLLISAENGKNTIIDENIASELAWIQMLKEKKKKVLVIVNKMDLFTKEGRRLQEILKHMMKCEVIAISACTGEGMAKVKETLMQMLPEGFGDRDITGDLVKEGDLVLLVMPQDIQAPKGRLILPQVQTLRELLDKKCQIMSVTTDQFVSSLKNLSKAPKLIITDSQVFGYVYENKPKESLLTSFSVLMSYQKGDLEYYVASAKAIDALKSTSKVLIAECCTHAPLPEDIGREKIPNMLRKKYGQNLQIEIVSGTDFPKDLTGYDLIIQCGGCMFNRTYIMARIDQAKTQGIPMTNYGVTIAYLNEIMDKIVMPK